MTHRAITLNQESASNLPDVTFSKEEKEPTYVHVQNLILTLDWSFTN